MSESVIQEQIQYYRRRAAEYDATAYGALGPAGPVFLDPPRLAAHLGALGWDCELTVDGEDWVIGRVRPRE